MPPPIGCPRAFYKLMVDCWNPDKRYRPSFREIVYLIFDNSSDMLGGKFPCVQFREMGKTATNIQNTMFLDLQIRYQVKTSHVLHSPINNQN